MFFGLGATSTRPPPHSPSLAGFGGEAVGRAELQATLGRPVERDVGVVGRFPAVDPADGEVHLEALRRDPGQLCEAPVAALGGSDDEGVDRGLDARSDLGGRRRLAYVEDRIAHLCDQLARLGHVDRRRVRSAATRRDHEQRGSTDGRGQTSHRRILIQIGAACGSRRWYVRADDLLLACTATQIHAFAYKPKGKGVRITGQFATWDRGGLTLEVEPAGRWTQRLHLRWPNGAEVELDAVLPPGRNSDLNSTFLTVLGSAEIRG